ncbi:MAG: hypothetical protein ABIM89_16175 [Mycobacteriales bacterium]
MTSFTGSVAHGAPLADDTAQILPYDLKHTSAQEGEEDEDENTAKLRDAYYETRWISGDIPLTLEQASKLRASAANTASQMRKAAKTSGTASPAVGQPWLPIGANPTVQQARTSGGFEAVSGRIAALAVRNTAPYTIYLGAAQGGLWTYDATSGQWSPKTDNLPSLSVGSLALAPSNQDVIYLGTGEGALSGDSYFGDGVWKSTDAGNNWTHISGTTFAGVSTSSIVVDPTNANHLYIAVLRGRGGIRRTTPPTSTLYGIYESGDGGTSWSLRKGTTNQFRGATDLDMDPQNPSILYASFWGDAIYKSTNAGATWAPAMTGLPAGDFAGSATRFTIGISHPVGQSAVLYTGFDFYDNGGTYHPSQVYKSTDDAANWTALPTGSGGDSVLNYCATQCFYDNVIEVDPTNPNIVFAAGQYDYGRGSGGIYRSRDGGQTWQSVGFDMHPDFHALAFDTASPGHVVVGNDGGVWQSPDYGGRLNPGDPLSAADWQNLNGTVNPATAQVTARSGLQIGQLTSIATVPTVPNRFWAGTQDNGTQRKSAASNSWFDQAGGDGGQVLVDPDNAGFVFGTYFGISPYRFSPSTVGFFNGNQGITNGINTRDRAEFYVPWVMNKGNTNQLFLGTYRLYRTNNGEDPDPAKVTWTAISPDLTSGCTGTAPNGARGCYVSAIGVADGGDAVYTGADDGYVYVSQNAVTSATPTWKRMDKGALPARPVTQFAVDRSNWQIAYAAYASFNGTTPTKPGHVFATINGGKSWKDISSNLPDAPVNSIILDPSTANTLYAGTDVGPFVTTNGGASWSPLGTAIPSSAIWQLDLDARNRVLAAGTHGRGAWRYNDPTVKPALIVSKSDDGSPVGPGSNLSYTIKVRNIGNADATGMSITDLIPVGTSFVSASNGGTLSKGRAVWSGLTVAKQASTSVTLTVQISPALSSTVTQIVNDKIEVASAQGASTTGSPHTTPIAPPRAVALTPASQTDGNKVGSSVDYPVHIRNLGYLADSYNVSVATGFSATVLDSTCTSAVTTTATIAAGQTTDVCFRVTVPLGATNGQTDNATVTATSTSSATVSGTAIVNTIAVTAATLLVDNDNDSPDVKSIYQAALTGAGQAFSFWDLGIDNALPLTYMKAHKNIVWFTGNSYPGPVLPYEERLSAFLDNGGRLMVSGQDMLDQAAGTTAFVQNYLHISWDGTEAQNDKLTNNVHGSAGGPVGAGLGTVPLDLTVLGADFMDQITPIAPALPEFTDDAAATNALSVDTGTYKVVALAYPFEEYGSAADKVDLVNRVMTFFGP